MEMVRAEGRQWMTQWVVGLVHEEEGVYGISFPDFPGCVSGGDTFEDAVRKGESALQFHVEGMIEEGLELPRPRTHSELLRDTEFRKASKGAAIIAVPLQPSGKSIRLNISLDERLLEQVDRAAEAAGQSRSAFLADAARSRLRQP
jgi:predicted RNase H-like HicB family nuclease